MHRRILLGALTALAVMVAWGFWTWRTHDQPAVTLENPRARVEVLNGTGVAGLARVWTLKLRRAGLDVVSYGNLGDTVLVVTSVIARRDDSLAASYVRHILTLGDVSMSPDSSRLLDVSIHLGLDAAAAVGLYP